jgi:hypothetical protein
MSAPKTPFTRLDALLLCGTLLLYAVVTLLADRPDLIWDEGRYLWFGENLTRGTYTTPEKPDLINGPGYPLVLAALLMLKTPLLGLRMFNAVFMRSLKNDEAEPQAGRRR